MARKKKRDRLSRAAYADALAKGAYTMKHGRKSKKKRRKTKHKKSR
jgi:hypothetical protein